MLSINKKTKVADIIFNNPTLILVLERLNIFLGFHEKNIEDLSSENDIKPDLLIDLFNMHLNKNYQPNCLFEINDITNIVNYLKNSHEYYTKEIYPKISKNIKQMYSLNNSTEILMLADFFNGYRKEVDLHFNYENDIVFPYITNLFNELNSKEKINPVANYSVEEYKQHHDDIEEKLDDLKSLLIKFLPPKKDTSVRREIIFDLFLLEQDLRTHAKIENDILIPFVEEIEKSNDLLK